MEAGVQDQGSPPHVPHHQSQSTLFGVFPPEIRHIIYSQLFLSTRLTYGIVDHHEQSARLMRPAPDTLAILRTCRQAREEIGDSWIGKVLFNFTESRYMSKLLESWPRDVLTKMRRLRVMNDPAIRDMDAIEVHYPLVPALEMLPGLRLDNLIVISSGLPELDYMTVSELVQKGDGWKELCYICPDSEMLAFKFQRNNTNEISGLERQPENWRNILNERDRPDSKPYIRVFRSTSPGVCKSVTNPNTRVVSEQVEFKEIMGDEEERTKELMVVVRRGHGIDYTQPNITRKQRNYDRFISAMVDEPSSDLSSDDERNDELNELPDLSDWQTDDSENPDPLAKKFRHNRPSVEMDQYTQADEFEWPSQYPKARLENIGSDD